MNIEQPRRCSAKPNGAAFQQRTARGDPSTNGPNPGRYPSPAGRATLACRLRPLGLDHRTHHQAVGLVQQER
jgi:hypothetical protein